MDYVAGQVFDYYPPAERVNNHRDDSLESLSEQEIFKHFRFGKYNENIDRLQLKKIKKDLCAEYFEFVYNIYIYRPIFSLLRN